jgi:hypothetical protein
MQLMHQNLLKKFNKNFILYSKMILFGKIILH